MTLNYNLATVLKLQMLYAGAGALFNAVSFWRISFGLTGLTSTPPSIGILAMAIVALAAWLGHKMYVKTFVLLNLALIASLFYAGLLRHILTEKLALTATDPTLLAISLNIFGIVIMTTGVVHSTANRTNLKQH